MEKKLRAAIYTRVSTQDQARDGYSIDMQKQKLHTLCDLNDYDIVGVYVDDGYSAKSLDRPEMKSLLNDIKEDKIDIVVTYKLDRLTRSVKDLSELLEIFNKYNTSYKSATEAFETQTAMGRMFIYMVGVMAAWERENIAERVALGYEGRAREGKYSNHQGIYGYKYIKGGDLEIIESEKILVNNIFDEYINGKSLSKIAQDLNSKGVSSKRGGYFTAATMKGIITNPTYIGKVRYKVKGEKDTKVFEGKHEAIVSNEVYNTANDLMSKRTSFGGRKFDNTNVIFNHVLYCDKCGRKIVTMRSGTKYKGKTKYYVRYRCSGVTTKQCDSKSISQNKFEELFLKNISNINLESENITLEDLDREDFTKEIKILTNELDIIKRKEKRAVDLLIEGVLEQNDFKEQKDSYKKRTEEINLELDKYKNKNKLEINHSRFIQLNSEIKQIIDYWDKLSIKDKSEFIDLFVNKILYNTKENEIKIIWNES